MKQVIQPTSGGVVRVIDVPRPAISPTEVLVRTVASVVSPGTERAVTSLAQSNLLAKAKARPDLVRQVVRKAQRDGVVAATRAVRSRLDGYLPLGYSAAGIAVEVGEAVGGIVPGQLVATGGAGKANHAEYQAVPGLLCVPVPDEVSAADAAFATVGSIALHGLRLADTGPGAYVVVIGLGLIGQLSIRLAQAAGCHVAGVDVTDGPAERARAAGALALVESGESTTKAIQAWTHGRGADAVLLTAATPSSNVIRRTPELCRDGATVVVVGDVGLEVERRPFYERELTVRFARSYGPGRYERSYEDWAVDYPPSQVRWTEGRNLEAVLGLLASGRLAVDDLVTHRMPIDDAAHAYELLADAEQPTMALLLTYGDKARDEGPVVLKPRPAAAGRLGLGLVGAGAFASTVLVPALAKAGFDRRVAVSSASGLSALRLAERAGFERAVSGAGAVIDDPDVDAVVVATRHDTHAELVVQALRAGKHVFCEKPLALTVEDLDAVEAAWRESQRVLFVGFNRRWSPAVQAVRRLLADQDGPLVVTYRVSAGALPSDHWYADRRQGGRLLGEVCHFVDTCAAITGEDAADVRAAGCGRGERALADDLALVLAYPSGSVATITYATGGHPGTPKERLDVLGRGHTAEVLDFRSLVVDGKSGGLGGRGKGHDEEAVAFHEAIRSGAEDVTLHALASTRTTLAALGSLLG